MEGEEVELITNYEGVRIESANSKETMRNIPAVTKADTKGNDGYDMELGEVLTDVVEESEETEVGQDTSETLKEEPETGRLGNATRTAGGGAESVEGQTAEAREVSGDEYAVGDELPTNDKIEEGEEQDFKPMIEEPLSCGRNSKQDDDETGGLSKLDLGTPDRERSPTAEGQEEEEKGPSVDCEDYISELHELQQEREELLQANGQLQMKLVEYFHKKMGEVTCSEKEKAVSCHDQRYLKYMSIMKDLKWQHQRDSELYQQQIEELRRMAQEKLAQVDQEWQTFMGLKQKVAVSALSRRLGKKAAEAEVEQIQAAEQHKEKELMHVRLENVKLKSQTRRYEAALRAKEELGEGLHLINFEQLKIENQTYKEKLEERNEELLKLRKSITGTVQVMTHVKEKLQFMQEENQTKKAQLAEVDMAVARRRHVLTRTKQARDALQADNLRLRQRCGLLGNEVLLRDFREKVDASKDLERKLEMLKGQHAELLLSISNIKKKLKNGNHIQTTRSRAQNT